MNMLSILVLIFYALGLMIVVASVVTFLLFKRKRSEKLENAIGVFSVDRLDNIESLEHARILLERHNKLEAIQTDLLSHLTAHSAGYKLLLQDRLSAVGISEASSLAMDINVGILEVTRKQETRLAKAQADELLNVLRDELAIPRADISSDEKLQLVRTRIIKLTEMLAEVQVSLTGVEHRVLDIESMVQQLPSVINNHRDNILSLYQSVGEVREKMATKSELGAIEKQLDLLKWSFSGAFGTVFTILGWILVRLLK